MALEGFYRWLDAGGRELLSRKAKARISSTRNFPEHIVRACVTGSSGLQ